MAFYLSPLVAVREIDLSTTIPAVATSIGVSVLRETYKGPELKQQFVSTVDELIKYFGEPTTDSYEDILSATGYLKYGNKLYCTRAMPPDAKFAGMHTMATSAVTAAVYTTTDAYQLDDFSSEDPDEFGNETVVFSVTQPEYGKEIAIIANSRGEWGNNIKIALIGKTVYDSIVNSTSSQVASAAATALGISTELYQDVRDIDSPLEPDSTTTGYCKEFLVLIRYCDQEDINKSPKPYSLVETWHVSTDTRKIDDEGKNIYAETVINEESEYIKIALSSAFANTFVTELYSTAYTSLAGGSNGTFAAGEEDTAVIAAYDLYQNPEDIDVNVFIDSNKSATVKNELISICEARMDAMAILDCLKADVVNNSGSEVTDLRDYRRTTLNPNTSYAAMYANWLDVFDKWNSKYRWVPASGHVAGIYANTDDVADPWWAPAGLNRAILNNVRKLAWNPTQGQRDILYKNGLNPIVSFAGQGKVVWGQKTLLDKSSAFNRVNVRRLFMVLEKAISTASKYFLFEPNDPYTRLQLINMIDPFLRDVKARRGLYEYLVVCDATNNTAERIDRNELWCDIYLKATRSAEFIVLSFIATKTGASFTELVSQTIAT